MRSMSGKEKWNETDVVSTFKLWVCVHMWTLTSKHKKPTVSVYSLLGHLVLYEGLNVAYFSGSLESRMPCISTT